MKRAIVSSMIAPLYISPKLPNELDDEALYGMTVDILEELPDGWYKIRTPYRYESYVEGKHLSFDEAELAAYESGSIMTVYAPTADILTGEDFQEHCLITVTRGALLNVLLVGEKWAKVRTVGGAEGYIRKTHIGHYHTVQHGGEQHFRDNVVVSAKSFLGTQYRWGGRTPMGIDCSGLMSESYYLNGVSIYRNANIVEGFPVHETERGQMKPGDLLFFKGHVAMYIGENRYIHSTGRAGDDGVVINSLDPSDADYREDLANGIQKIGTIF